MDITLLPIEKDACRLGLKDMNNILERLNSRSEWILHPSRLSTSFCKSKLSFISVIVLKHFVSSANSSSNIEVNAWSVRSLM